VIPFKNRQEKLAKAIRWVLFPNYDIPDVSSLLQKIESCQTNQSTMVSERFDIAAFSELMHKHLPTFTSKYSQNGLMWIMTVSYISFYHLKYAFHFKLNFVALLWSRDFC